MDVPDPPHIGSTESLEVGMKALERGDWDGARSAFERARREGESPEISSGLAEALWWLGETRESLDCWERAYLGFRQRPDIFQAALVSVQLAVIYNANMGNYAASAGWTARAERLVEEHALEPLRGWVLILKTIECIDPERYEALARQAHQVGRASGDRDVELCALTQIGVALIDQGKVTEGMAFHDEAMAAALAGEGRLDTVVFTACQMMTSYSRCAQYQRMAQWIRAAEAFTERYGCPYLSASCRTYYGEVLFATGDWAQAEKVLHAALRLSADSSPAVRAKALARLADLRLAQGRVEEAERLLAGFEDYEEVAPVRARIHLVLGRFALAEATVRRWLGAIGENRLQGTTLLELLGEAEIGQGRAEPATGKGRLLAELGRTLDCRVMLAKGERLLGHALTAGADADAKQHLDAALREFIRLEMPFEASRTRLLLAQALCDLAPEVAEAEARSALAVFEKLGASECARAATDLLSEIEVRTREPSNLAGLSKRELEVLRLVAQGMSDKEIAVRLVLSRHTVHRHISNILAKLDLPSRTAAATYAAQHDLL